MGTDAFGRAFMNFYSGRDAELIFERDDGYSNSSDLPVYFRGYEEFPKHEKGVLSYAKGKVLDIGCGAGRHSIWLLERGFDVTSLDSSLLALELCKEREVEHPILGEIQYFPFKKGIFDSIILLGNGFGLAGRLEDTIGLLRDLHEITTNEGLVLTDSRNYLLTREKAHLEYHEMNRRRGRPAGEVRIRARCDEEISDWFYLLMVTPEEMEEVCKRGGWRVKEFFEFDDPGFGAVLEKARP
ncbi:MAG: class I SAM-dependent methyltransferase [Thermoplasmata archaeon]